MKQKIIIIIILLLVASRFSFAEEVSVSDTIPLDKRVSVYLFPLTFVSTAISLNNFDDPDV